MCRFNLNVPLCTHLEVCTSCDALSQPQADVSRVHEKRRVESANSPLEHLSTVNKYLQRGVARIATGGGPEETEGERVPLVVRQRHGECLALVQLVMCVVEVKFLFFPTALHFQVPGTRHR